MLYYIVAGLFCLHYFIDTHYFLRLAIHMVGARFFSKRIKVLEPSVIYGICMTPDVDFNLNHMNNARYQREFDFGRMAFGIQSNFFNDVILKRKAKFVVAGSTLRYRLPLKIFAPYKVVTNLVGWQGKFFFFDQRIITPFDGICRAIGHIKVAMTINIDECMAEVYPEISKPPIPEEIQKWMEAEEISRTNMKKNL